MWRSAVQLRAGLRYGGIAQLVEHLLCKQGVKSSNLFISTKNRSIDFFGWPILFLSCSKRRRFRYQMPHSKKVCNANQIFQLYQGIDISTKKRSTKMPLCERTRYQKQASTVRNMRAVLKKASWGTRRIFWSIRCKKQAFPARKRYSVPKTGSWGTRRIFKGPQNSRLHRLWTASCPPDASPVRETAPARMWADIKRGWPLSLSRLFSPRKEKILG